MRRRLAWILCGVSAICWASCGSSDPPVQLPSTSITRARADAVARKITIRAGDLPEFKATAHLLGAQSTHQAVVKRSCGGSRPPFRPWAQAGSQELSAGNGYHALDAFSGVAVMPTAAAADLVVSDLRKIDLACMEREFRREFTKGRSRVRGVFVGRLPTIVSDSAGSVAYQAVISWRTIPLVLYMDITLFAYGQDVVALFTYHSSDPVPPAMESRLLGLLVARAKAHSR